MAGADQPPRLPSGFKTIRAILDGQVAPHSLVNVIGILTDLRAPYKTLGTDWKCDFKLYDASNQWEKDESLSMNVFRPEHEMPTAGSGDVIVICSAKVQKRAGELFSLCSNYRTDIHVFDSALIPKPHGDVSVAARPPQKKLHRPLSKPELAYIPLMYHHVDKDRVPTAQEFSAMQIQSCNIKDKNRELGQVSSEMFCDVLVQLVRDPYDTGGSMTLWVSDYTENEAFYNFSLSGASLGKKKTNPYNYDTPGENLDKDWTGPYGKRSLQVTCYEPHAGLIRDRELRSGDWVSLRNLQIKYGRNGSNLEGFLREDLTYPHKINVTIHSVSGDRDNIDPRLKSVLRKKREYEQARKEQLRSIQQAVVAGRKRKDGGGSAEPTVPNRKQKREQQKALMAKKLKQDEMQALAPSVGINSQIKCENMDKPVTTVADMLAPQFYETTVDGQAVRLEVPFINSNYRAIVRVTDFLPQILEDFCRPKASSEYDILSDYESDTQSTPDDGMDGHNDSYNGVWEWQFFLELEDASPEAGEHKERIWVSVGNFDAQCLLSLDASDLYRDDGNRQALREKLFLLWGDLEERKIQYAANFNAAIQDGPPPDSSDDEDGGRSGAKKNGNLLDQIEKDAERVNNRPFSCCIKQFGSKTSEPDESKATAGDGKRWERTYGLFGTCIRAV